MNQNDMQQVKKLLSGAQGQQLLKLLSRDGGAAMQKAGQALKQGNEAQAQDIMAPLLEDPQVRSLLESLGQSMGNG